jgi:plastocyanin domain-containing protein
MKDANTKIKPLNNGNQEEKVIVLKTNHLLNAVIVIAVVIISILGIFMMLQHSGITNAATPDTSGTAQQDEIGDKQTLNITAKAGYRPQNNVLKADKTTVLKIQTNSTYDCSSGFTIPKLNIEKNLPPSGTTEIIIPAQKSGTKITAMCSMGMYQFTMNFQ